MFYSKKFKLFRNISHCFFSRKGGFSKGVYSSLNCGKGSKDNKNIVHKNLNLVTRKIKGSRKQLKLMYQTHSNKVIVINKRNNKKKYFKSDAIITKMKGCALGVMTADCLPVILYDAKNQIIACVYAGWKGSISGIIENTISAIKKLNQNNKIYACIGPCIGKNSYEVGMKFYKKFISKSKKNTIYFKVKSKNKKIFDIRNYVSDKLLRLNVKVDHVNRDTFKDKNNFFSYRRSQKLHESDYGRCISVISLL